MEIIDGNRLPERQPKRKEAPLAGNIYLGTVLVAIGLVWLLYNLHWISYGVFSFLFSWPMLLIVIGGYLLALRRRSAGLIIGGLGALFLVLTHLNITMSMGKIVFPVLLVAAGIALITSMLGKEGKK